MNKLQGYRVWIGIASTIIGVTGLAQFITPAQFTEVADLIFKLFGILMMVYGNIKSHQKIEELGGYK